MTFLKDKDTIETQYLLVYIARMSGLSFDHVCFSYLATLYLICMLLQR